VSTPADPMTTLGVAAASMHELYTSFRKAGFSRDEGMELLSEVVRNSMPQPPQLCCPHCGKQS